MKTDESQVRALRLLRIERNVSSLPDAVSFYCNALGFEVVDREMPDVEGWQVLLGGRSLQAVDLRLGKQQLRLTSFDPPGAPYPVGSHSNDLWFQHIAIVTCDIEGACERLKTFGYSAITQSRPVQLPPEDGNVTAYKFRDPDGHPLELIQFPPGSGDPGWQNFPADALTLGIDHSAISVASADDSIAFYAGMLKLDVASRQVNQGPAQDKLDRLSGDRVEVVALKPSASPTPHIELLMYQHPLGRPTPRPRTPLDISADRLVLEITGVLGLIERLGDTVIRSRTMAGGSIAALIQVPNGHYLILTDASDHNGSH